MSSSALIAAVLLSLPQSGGVIPREGLPPALAALSDDELGRIAKMSPLPPLGADPTNRFAESEAAAALGHRLFFDTRLSPKGVSCATCHEPERWFTDGKRLAEGVAIARRNSPTVIDAARRRWNGWDGKFDSLWSQALSPIENPVEMGGSRGLLVKVVRDDSDLRARYESVFGPFPQSLNAGPKPDPLGDETVRPAEQQAELDRTAANLLKSLGAYQRRLLSGEAPIDRFVASLKKGAVSKDLSDDAQRGLAIFVGRGGCYQCHRGASFTDEEFHALGLVGANGKVPDDPARLAAVDFLQSNPFNAAGVFSDGRDSQKASLVRGLRRGGELFGQFRTPPLRGVARTGPYMHDGRFASLDDVVRFYDTLEGASPAGHHGEQVLAPIGLDQSGRADLRSFLESLTPIPPDSAWTTNPKGLSVRSGPPSGGR